MADGHFDDLTEVQYHAIPHMVALIASLENGTYKESHQDNDVISIEDYTKMRLGGLESIPKVSREQLKASGVFFEETNVPWENTRAEKKEE